MIWMDEWMGRALQAFGSMGGRDIPLQIADIEDLGCTTLMRFRNAVVIQKPAIFDVTSILGFVATEYAIQWV